MNLFEEWSEAETPYKAQPPPAPTQRAAAAQQPVPAPHSRRGSSVGGSSKNPFEESTETSKSNKTSARNPFAEDSVHTSSAVAERRSVASTSTHSTTSSSLVGDAAPIEDPIFSLYKGGCPGLAQARPVTWSILAAAVAGGAVVLGTSDCRVIRWYPDASGTGGVCDEVEISRRPEDTIGRLFLDTTGSHLMVTLHGGETYYLHKRSGRPRRLSKWSNVPVECIAFDRRKPSETAARSVVIGSRTGELYEGSLESNGEEKPLVLLHSLAAGKVVSSLLFESLQSTSTTASGTVAETRLLVLATTASPTLLYTFLGAPSPTIPTLETLFRRYRDTGTEVCQELPPGVPSAELQGYWHTPAHSDHGPSTVASKDHNHSFRTNKFLTSSTAMSASGASPQPVLSCFALLTGMGIYHGKVVCNSNAQKAVTNNTSSVATRESVIEACELRQYPSIGGGRPPRSLAVTEHHFLLLYDDRLLAISRLSGEAVEEAPLQHLSSCGHPVRFCSSGTPGKSDTSTDTHNGGGGLWIMADKCPIRVVVSRESRDVWRFHLERALRGGAGPAEEDALFEAAAQHCPGPTEEALLKCARAAQAMRSGRYLIAAELFAETPSPFEEVVLQLMEVGGGEPLRAYISGKLSRLSPSSHKAQRTMLSTWLAELYLCALDKADGSSSSISNDRTISTNESEKSNISTTSVLTKEFRIFLERYASALNPSATAALLASHGRSEEALFFAELTEDYERVLAHHLAHYTGRNPNYPAALAVLRKAPLAKVEALIYRYSVELVDADPGGTISMWIDKPGLKRPTKLIPALLRYSKHRRDTGDTGPDWAVAYLSHCVNVLKLQDPAIHNHLLTLYAQAEAESGEDGVVSGRPSPLLELLSRPPGQFFFDLKYALRVCTQLGRRRACVQIYSVMGLYEEAVELALEVDIHLAKLNADKPKDPELRKRLWLKIACHSVQTGGGEGHGSSASAATAVLEECGDLLKIEDVLPFFPDFAVIDAFKADICSSLEAYNARIDRLKAEMREYTESIEATQAEISSLRRRSLYMGGGQPCELCLTPAVARELYLFPCGHAFHSDCLKQHVMPRLLPEQAAAVVNLTKKLKTDSESGNTNNATAGVGGSPTQAQTKRAAQQLAALQSELDGYLAAECVLCGGVMIRSIEAPLVESEADAQEALRWSLPSS